MRYKIYICIYLIIIIGFTISGTEGEPNPYMINSFYTVDELKKWAETISVDQVTESDYIKLYGDITGVTRYIKSKGVPIPTINYANVDDFCIITHASLYNDDHSTGCSGINYSLEYSGESSLNISINIEIISEENKASAQDGVLEYLKQAGAMQKFYENKTAVFNRYGCSVNCRIIQDKLEELSIGGQQQYALIRTYQTGWGEPDGNRIIFIYNDFCVTIYNLDDLNILNEFSIEVEPL